MPSAGKGQHGSRPGPRSAAEAMRRRARRRWIVAGTLLALFAAACAIVGYARRGPRRRDATSAFAARASPQDAALVREANDAANQLLQRFPNSPEALEVMALLYLRFGSREEALGCFRECLELDPEFAAAYQGLGVLARAAGEHAQAADYFRKALEREPDSAALSADLADALVKLGRLDEAAAVVRKSLEIRPRFLPSLYQLGEILLQQKEYEKARRVLEDAVQVDPGFSNAYHGLATAYARLGDEEKSKAAMEKLKALRAREAAEHQRILQAGEGAFETVRNLADVYTAAAKVYLAHGEPAAAEPLLVKASQLYPDHADAPQVLAWVYEQEGRSEEAVKTLTELGKRMPREVSVQVRLGELCARLGRFDEGEQAYRSAIQLVPSQAESYAALAGLYLRANRKLPEAKTLALKAVALRPSAECYALLGAACQRNGDGAGARRALQQALVLKPGNAQYRRAFEMLGGSPKE